MTELDLDVLADKAALAHFGIKGMRWGIRKEEKGGDSSPKLTKQEKQEAQVQKFVLKADLANVKISELNAQTFRWGIGSGSRDRKVNDLIEVRDQALEDAERKRQGKLTRKQKKVIVGASVAAVIIGAVAIRKGAESGQFNRLSMKGKAFLSGNKEDILFKKNPLLADKNLNSDEVFGKVVKHVNPGYGKIGTKLNCRRCTFAYELRRRGYDVAATKTTKGTGQKSIGLLNATDPATKGSAASNRSMVTRMIKEGIAEVRGNTIPTPLSDISKGFPAGARNRVSIDSDANAARAIFESLAKEPNKSRGELGVLWRAGGGHSMAYEIFDGKPVVFDSQTGSRLSSIEELAKHGSSTIKSAGFTRLDDVDLNEEFLLRWAKNAK